MTSLDLRNAAWTARCVGRGELSPFTDDELRDLARVVGSRRLPVGSTLMTEGDESDRVSIVLSGTVELTRRHGGKRVVLHTLREGDVFGDIPFLCGKASPFTATCGADVEVVELDAGVFWRLLEERPHVTRRFLFSLAARLERMQERLVALTAGDLRHQVSALLLDETNGTTGSLTIAQSTLAELLGATRPSVNRVLKELESEGAISLGYRRVDVVAPDRLRAVAEG